ncbi:MAG: hypothetical protein ACREYE_15800 [Gammaproteobacteria bacterium]
MREIKAGKRLVDVPCSRLACLGVDAVPALQAIRHVAVLLHLKHYDAVAGPSRKAGQMVR